MVRTVIRPALVWATLMTTLVMAPQTDAEDWPGWRGPRGDGTSLEEGIPTEWSATENIAWKVPTPGVGHSSPIVYGDRVFVVSCREEAEARILLCLDRRTGATLWERTVLITPLEGKHKLNSFASGTPATDGRFVFVTFLDGEQMFVAAYDFEGSERWVARPGVFSSRHGYSSSPVFFEDKVIVNGDHDGDAYLVALSRETGGTIWKTSRENKTRSYVTPIIRTINGEPHMILSGSMSVTSYDPRDGSRYWIINGPTEQYVASMVYNGDLLFMTAGFPDHHILAIRPDGHGDVTDSHIVWRTQENCSYVPSPIVVGGYFLIVSDEGIGSCYVAETGERVWRERMGPHYSASLVTAGGLCYFLSDEGVSKVVRPGREYELVATNELGEFCYASPAISEGQIFIRAEQHLYCIGQPSP